MTGNAMLKAVLGLVLMVIAAVPVASLAADVRPVVRIGFDFGGDKLAGSTFTNGSTDTIKAGELIYLGAGLSVITDSKEIQVGATLPYTNARLNASNGKIDWTRFPVDSLFFYRIPNFRLGG